MINTIEFHRISQDREQVREPWVVASRRKELLTILATFLFIFTVFGIIIWSVKWMENSC